MIEQSSHSVSILPGVQSRDSPIDLPGPLSSWQRHLVSPGPAHRQDHRDAPGAQGELAGALQSRRSEQEEDRTVSMLWSSVLQHSLGQEHHSLDNVGFLLVKTY